MTKPTKAEINDAQAGREIDTWIATILLGWQVIETDDCNGFDNYWLSKDGQNVWYDVLCGPLALPHYSTSWSAMKEVVERMKAKYYSFELGDNHEKGEYYACFQEGNTVESFKDHWGYADTAPLAVAKAALMARREDEE